MQEDYINLHSCKQDEVLDWLEKQTNLRTNHARMLCGHVEGKLLEFITSMLHAKNALEIGTFTGYSAICIARGLAKNGLLDAIEINDELEDLIREGFKKADLTNKINLIIGDALEELPKLNRLYDFAFIDANKREYCDYYDIVISKMHPGGYIIADNVLWSGKIESDIPHDAQSNGIHLFNEKIVNDPRVENIILPIRDGINILRVKEKQINTPEYSFKQASKSDIPIIQEIANITFRDTYQKILSHEQLEWMYNWMYSKESLQFQMEHDHTFFIIKIKKEGSDAFVPVGYISIEKQEKKLFHLQKIYLLPAMQGKGLGKVLIDKGIDYVKSFGLKSCKIELNVNRSNKAVDFYKKMGFTIEKSGDFDIGNGYYMNDYIMSITI